MPDCPYCDESLADEAALLDHLGAAHEGELSRIDRRRVEQAEGAAGDRSRLVVYGAIVLVLAVVAAGGYAAMAGDGGSARMESRPLPERGDAALLGGVERFPSEGAAHVDPGTPIDYDTSPPTSGPHYGSAATAGYYTEPRPAGNLVHSLEHGAVVVYYDPAALSPDAEESLRAFADAHADPWASVIVVPNPDADAPYVLTAWRTMLETDGYDPAVVRAFLAEYLGRGPENPVR